MLAFALVLLAAAPAGAAPRLEALGTFDTPAGLAAAPGDASRVPRAFELRRAKAANRKLRRATRGARSMRVRVRVRGVDPAGTRAR